MYQAVRSITWHIPVWTSIAKSYYCHNQHTFFFTFDFRLQCRMTGQVCSHIQTFDNQPKVRQTQRQWNHLYRIKLGITRYEIVILVYLELYSVKLSLTVISKLPLVVLGSIEAQYYPIHSFVLRQYWEHQCSIELTNVVLKLYWRHQCCIETTICCIDITKCCIDTTFAVLKSPQWYWHNHCSIEIITVVLKTSLQYWKRNCSIRQ